jgi:large subunit ribosomal protein L29
MKNQEIVKKSDAELQKEIEALLKEQFNLRMQQGTGQKVNNHRFKETRRAVARIKTHLHARQQAEK